MSENLKNREQKPQCISCPEDNSFTGDNQNSEAFAFNDPLPWEDVGKSEAEMKDCYDPESDPITDYFARDHNALCSSTDTYEEKPKFYCVEGLMDSHAVELAAAIKKLDYMRDKYYSINSILKRKTRLVYLVEHLNSHETKELFEYRDDYLKSLDDLNCEIRLFAQRIDDVAQLLRLIAAGAEKIKEIEGRMNITFVSEVDYNSAPVQYGE